MQQYIHPVENMTKADFLAFRGERVREAMHQKIRRGECAGPAPLGYKNVRGPQGEPRIEIDEEVAPLVRVAFKLVATRRMSLRKVWAEVTALGLRTKKGKPLSFSAFQLMIGNPFYWGMLRYKGEVYQGKHEPLISQELFEIAQRCVRSS